MSILKIPTARVFDPLLAPARYKCVHGSGKSHFFGELLVETCQAERGTLAVCIREAQRTLAQSSKRLIESKITGLGLSHQFKLFSDKIETPGDGMIIFRGMQNHTADSMKSLEGSLNIWERVIVPNRVFVDLLIVHDDAFLIAIFLSDEVDW